MDGSEPDEEREVAWLAMPEKAPVMGESGEEIGRMEEVLGDEEDDIFHGIVLKLARGGHKVEVRAERIPKITTRRVYTDLTADELEHLPPIK
jgi:PRC-barrel domain